MKRQQKEEECREKALMREIARKERQKQQCNESMTSKSSPEYSNDSFEDMVVNKCFKCYLVFEPTEDINMKAAGCDKC